jgi:hypothetical protein
MQREPCSGHRWTELFVDTPDAGTAANALEGSHSLALFDAVATPAECALLCEVAATAARQCSARIHDSDGQAVQSGRFRARIDDSFLDRKSQALCDLILCRAITLVDESLPTLLPRLFGSVLCSKESILHHPGLIFSPGEPAINVYTRGGRFDAHTDKQSLTILVPLSQARDGIVRAAGGDPDDPDHAVDIPKEEMPSSAHCGHASGYEGGGTAFFGRDAIPNAPSSAPFSPPAQTDMAPRPPTLVTRPAPGTAIVFCGDMRHAGQPVVDGVRCVLVASFSPTVLAPSGTGQPSLWEEHPSLPQDSGIYVPAPQRKQSPMQIAIAAARKAKQEKASELSQAGPSVTL